MDKIIVTPFVKIIEKIFLFVLKIVQNPGAAIIFLRMAVSIILSPFYYIAEKIEQKERDIQDKMRPKIEEFKSVYKGQELHLYIKNVYRLNGYKPIYSLRGLVSLLIQIPFFIGAYTYLSNYIGFQGVGFLNLSNLAEADALIKLGRLSINVLPFLMTFINLAAGYVYAKDKDVKDKATIVLIALVFLIILYNSPSSLLIYWTFNNLFSLVKNIIIVKLDTRKKIMGGKTHVK